MHTPIESIIIQDQRPRLPYLLAGLAAQGWVVRACKTTSTLADLVDVRVPQVLILENGQSDLRTTIGIARYAAPNAALIVLIDDVDVDARIVALDAGADACCLMSTDVRELCALGRALNRLRMGGAGRVAREAPLWRLTHSGRVLAGPRGQNLPLTFTESAFFLRLLSSPGYRLPRERLVMSSVSAAGSRRRHSARSVDVMVSRLRAKAERLGVGLPLLAVRQWGYIFLADAMPDGEAGDQTSSTVPAGYAN